MIKQKSRSDRKEVALIRDALLACRRRTAPKERWVALSLTALAACSGSAPGEAGLAQTRTVTAPAPTVVEAVRDCDNCPALVSVPLSSEITRSPAQRLYVGRYEVTWAEYLQAVDEAQCRPPRLLDGSASNPKDERLRDNVAVTGVSLADAQCYVSWLSRRTGKRYRIPTNDEWEAAARGGASTRYPWGDDLGTNNAFVGTAFDLRRYPIKDFLGPRSPSNIREVGMLPPNAFGLHDVIGNARELTSSVHVHPEGQCLGNEPRPCRRIIVRSGYDEATSSLSNVGFHRVDQADPGTGFRVVRDC